MFETLKVKIKPFENGAWWLITEKGEEYRVTSINQHCTDKLQKLHDENNAEGYMTLEPITEYYSENYRTKISRIPDPGWIDDDIACLVTNETGNMNPNAARDIRHANEIIKVLGEATN